jgi:hypothetical protein
MTRSLFLGPLFILSTMAFEAHAELPDSSHQLSFTKSSQVFEPAWTRLILLRDLDTDGDLDAVFSNCTLFDSQVWLNDGHGTFTITDQLLSKQAHGIDMGDLDGDGDLDIFITCHYFFKDDVPFHLSSRVYLNDGSGRFHDSDQQFGDSLLSGNEVYLSDIDGDGDLDAMVDYYEEPNRIYLNDGAAGFSVSGNSYPDGSTFGDLNSDGHTDLLAVISGIGYEVWLGQGDGTFTKSWQLDDSTAMNGINSLADLDRDGDLDALLTRFYRSDRLPAIVLYNDGAGKLSRGAVDLPAISRGRVTLGDLNNDGFLDGIAASHGEQVQIWLNDGKGTLSDSGLRLGKESDRNESAALGDIDNDGDLDIFVAEGRGGRNVIWFNELTKE